MKKLIYLIVVIGALALIVAGCGLLTAPPSEESELDSKVKPSDCATIKDGTLETSDGDLIVLGYDEWGYNYQAHIFNGRYCDSDRKIGGDYCDVNLIMKWNDAWLSNKDCDGDDELDRPDDYIGSGAWCTNHMWGSYPGDCWSFVGDWVLEFDFGGASLYVHDMTVTDDDCFSFTGTGSYRTNPSYTWTIEGTLNGGNTEDVDFVITYLTGNPGYVITATGTIAPDGTMSGTMEGNPNQKGTWKSTMGTALCEWYWFVKMVAVPVDAGLEDGIWYTADGTVIGPVEWGAFATVQSIYNDPCDGYEGVEYLSPAGPGLGKW